MNGVEIRKLAQAIIDEAFKIAPPNPHTPRLVMLAQAIQWAAIEDLALEESASVRNRPELSTD